MAEESDDIRSIVQAVIQEFVKAEQTKAEPAYKTELVEERKRRESLEQRVNELVAENQQPRRRQRKRSGARRFGRSCRSWGSRRSIWRTRR